ncbi:MAG TPA: hypothetical protein VE842_03810, partial [Pyrinomonadaceae bacterium]|nr:hypothetical protein [Pyrinomonadaceae bacterium]
VTYWTMLAGWLAISGVPIFAGFFSKDEILWKTWSAAGIGFESGFGKILWVIGAITAGLTAVYMTRLMVMTFRGTERFREAHAGGQADEAHAHAFDVGEESHDAHLASAGDRPRHAPGDEVTAELTIDEPDTHGGGGAHDEHEPPNEHNEHNEHDGHEPHESPWTMTVPLIILAVLSTVGGLVGIPYALSGGRIPNYFEHTLEPAIAHAPEAAQGAVEAGGHEGGGAAEGPRFLSPTPQPHDGASPLSVGEGSQAEPMTERAHSAEEVRDERIFSGISVLIALAGIGLGWMLFKRRPLMAMPRLLENKYYVDEIYDAAIINPIKEGSREGLWKLFDVAVIDGIVNGLGRGVAQIGALVRLMQGGFVRSYAAVILLGALAIIGYFAYYSIKIILP